MGWLTSCDDDELAVGANIAAIGSELVQFGEATPLGQGQFRLGRLLRGRGGTEWACSIHAINEFFCVIEPGSVQPLPLSQWSIGAAITAAALGSSSASATISAESIRPPRPVKLAAAVQPTGEMVVSWTRRSRDGWSWIDDVDAPLCERIEQYRGTIAGSASTAEFLTD